MNLVYPIYLDSPMMTAFLASLEGGLVEETDIEGKTADLKEKEEKFGLGVKVSKLLSSFIDAEVKGELAGKVSKNLESQYKSTVRFPNAALFIRLREIMMEQNQIKTLNAAKDLSSIQPGDIVEFQGIALPNPAYQIRSLFNQILPILEPIHKLQENQIEKTLIVLKDAKPKQVVNIDNKEIELENSQQIKTLRDLLNVKLKQLQNESTNYQVMGETFNNLFPEDDVDMLLFSTKEFSCLCKVYSAFARNERIRDICDATWFCLGKVIGKISEDDQYDLLKGSPIGYLAQEKVPDLANLFKNEHFNVNIVNPVVSGPALIVAPLAIFT